MKSIHNSLKEHVSWYRNWHEKSYADNVHYLVLLAMASMDLYLGAVLLSVISAT